jgi:hypothetical protein
LKNSPFVFKIAAMNKLPIYIKKIFYILFFLISGFLQIAKAQTSPYLSVTYKDSLLADEKSFFVYNHINIVNTFNQVISFSCAVNVPDGWKVISQNNLYIELAPGESYPLNITLNRSKIAAAEWKQAQLKIVLKNNPDTNFYNFYVKAGIIKNFRAATIIKEVTVNDGTDYADLPVKILNSGNTKVEYQLLFYNYLLELNDKVKFFLEPGKDTSYLHRIKFPPRVKKGFVKEKVFLNINQKDGKSALYSYDLLRSSSYRKIHPSAYTTFPLVLSSGVLINNNKYSGYLGVNGAYTLKNNDKIIFGYRSKQIGISGLQSDVFNIGFLHKKWTFYAGQVNELGLFYINGNGLKVIYNKNSNTSYGAHFVKSNLFGVYGKNIGLWANYKWGKKILYNEIIANYDNGTHINSYVQNNKITFFNTKKLFFDVNAGAGFMDNKFVYVKTVKRITGFSAGYHFKFNLSKWLFKSNVEYNNDGFPGVYQGYRMQMHDARWMPAKAFYLGAQYQSSYFKRSFFRDSIYYRSKLLSNMRQYGIITGVTIKSVALNLNGGYLTNAIQENYTAPVYKYINAGLSFPLFKKINFTINRTQGQQANYGPSKTDLSLHSTSAGIMSKWGGIQYLEEHLPVFGFLNNVQDFTYYQDLKTYGPFLNKDFPKLHLQLRLQYNYSIITPDTSVNQNTTISAFYTNDKTGLNIEFTGSRDIRSAHQNQYGFLTISKAFNVPAPRSRKYYNLTINLFNDKNNNGVKEKDEPDLTNATVIVNEQPYITDKKGKINIINTDKGVYQLDFHNMQSKDGIIPANGFKQHIAVIAKTNAIIPFKKGRIISGNISVILDSLSHLKFSPDLLKVIVTDSTGDKFSTLTDTHGNFTIGVPAGKYIVSLNPQAFDETFKPVQIAFTADLINNEEERVFFKIKQKQRKLIMVKPDGSSK